MFRKYVIPLLAVAGLAFAVYTVRSENQTKPPAQPVAQPARSPFVSSVAGSGIIEASSQNIAIGTNIAGIVQTVHVVAGAQVKKGAPLFTIDDRSLRAELALSEAQVRIAEQTLARLRAQPRPEDLPPMEAKVREAEAQLSDAKAQLALMESIEDKRAVSMDDLTRRRGATITAQARVASARADLELLKSGAWTQDVQVVEAQLAQAKAAADQIRTEIDRLSVKAPVDGEVLQVNVRVGEYAATPVGGNSTTPLMLVGSTDTLHVRVDVDENDAWRVRPGAKARIALRGNSSIGTDVTFVRVEPYVIPKRSLTGESAERVDTRVLQVLYKFPRTAINAYVGQLVDVHIDAPGADSVPPAQSPRG